MQFLGNTPRTDCLESTALHAAIRAFKICQDAALPFDAADHRRWCEERVQEPVIIKIGQPETRGAYLKKHTTYLVTEERSNVRVRRRFSDFEWLHSVLKVRFVGMLLPSLPEKNMLQSEAFIQSRIRGLSLFLHRLMASPYLRGDPAVTIFFTKTDDKDWEAAKQDTALLENGGAGLKRWIKRIAMQSVPASAEHDIAIFKRQVEQQEKITNELAACAKRLAEKSSAMAKDVNALHSLFNGWSVAETTSPEQNAELLLALGNTTTVTSHWASVAGHESSIYELILYESLRFFSYQVKDMKELLIQREAAMLLAAQPQLGQAKPSSVASAASSLAARFRSGSDAVTLEQNQLRGKQTADLVTRALLAEEMERFRQQKESVLSDTMSQFAFAQGQLTKKSAGIWRDYVKTNVTNQEELLQNTKQIMETASEITGGSSEEAYFA